MKLVVINGTTGVGKSTIAEKLQKSLAEHTVLLDIDKLRRLISNHRNDIESSSRWTAQNALHMASTALEAGYDVVFDKMFTNLDTPVQKIWRSLLDDLENVASRHNANFFEFILTAEESILMGRNHARAKKFGYEVNIPEVLEFIRGSEAHQKERPEAIHVDTSHLTPDEAFEEIRSRLN